MSEDLDSLMARLEAQEEQLVFRTFDTETSWRLGVHLIEAARARNLPVVISIRRNGQRLFHAALKGASTDNDAWVDRKAAVVDHFGHSSYLVGTRFLADGQDFDTSSRLDPYRFAAHGGAFPILIRGVGAVGTVCVSGLTAIEDHAFVVEELEKFLRADGQLA